VGIVKSTIRSDTNLPEEPGAPLLDAAEKAMRGRRFLGNQGALMPYTLSVTIYNSKIFPRAAAFFTAFLAAIILNVPQPVSSMVLALSRRVLRAKQREMLTLASSERLCPEGFDSFPAPMSQDEVDLVVRKLAEKHKMFVYGVPVHHFVSHFREFLKIQKANLLIIYYTPSSFRAAIAMALTGMILKAQLIVVDHQWPTVNRKMYIVFLQCLSHLKCVWICLCKKLELPDKSNTIIVGPAFYVPTLLKMDQLETRSPMHEFFSYPSVIERRHEIGFYGVMFERRAKFLSRLANLGCSVHTPSHPLPLSLYAQNLFETRIGLNFNWYEPAIDPRLLEDAAGVCFKDRVFDCAAFGVLILTNENSGIQEFFTQNREYFYFESPEEVLEIVEWSRRNVDSVQRMVNSARAIFYEVVCRKYLWEYVDEQLPVTHKFISR
jgi:hypothetical protein